MSYSFFCPEAVTKFRLSLGLTQDDLSQILMVSRTTINQWEHDHCKPKIDNLTKLIEYGIFKGFFKNQFVGINYFFGGYEFYEPESSCK